MSGKDTKEKPRSRLVKKAKSFKADLRDRISNIQIRRNQPSSLSPPMIKVKKNKKVGRAGSFNEASTTDKLWKQNDMDKLEEDEMRVERSLKFIQYAINKGVLQMLPGSVTALMEAVMEMNALHINLDSSLLLSCHGKVYQCLADVICWADSFLLNKDLKLNQEKANDVIQNLRDAVKELVSFSLDKLHNTSYGTLQKTPSTKSNKSRTDSNHRNSLPEIPLTPREREILCETHYYDNGSPLMSLSGQHYNEASNGGSITRETVVIDDLPPPKPPLPNARLTGIARSSSDNDVLDAPPLPMKACASGMRLSPPRNLDQGQRSLDSSIDQSEGLISSPLSTSPSSIASSINKSRENLINSTSSENLLEHSSVFFNDSSSFERSFEAMCSRFNADVQLRSSRDELSTLASQITALTSRSMETNNEPDSDCPPLPVKKRERLPSDYDNVESDVTTYSEKLVKSYNSKCKSTKISTSMNEGRNITSNHQVLSISNTGSISMSSKSESKTKTTQISSTSSARSLASSISTPEVTVDQQRLVKAAAVQQQTLTIGQLNSNLSHSQETAGSSGVFSISSSESANSFTRPPPLPLKQKQVEAYMLMLGSYTKPSAMDLNRHSVHSYNFYHTQWVAHQRQLFYPRSNTVSIMSEISSSSDVFDDRSPTSPRVPSIPPKKKSSSFIRRKSKPPEPVVTFSSSDHSLSDGEADSGNVPEIPPKEGAADLDSDFGEVNLLDDIDVSDQLIRTKDGGDVTDIRGGALDALIVHATRYRHGKTDFIYQEAFLTTYRTFICSEELIKKLQYRYMKFSQKNDTGQKRLSRNAFSLLIRVVDELYGSELSPLILENLMEMVCYLLCSSELMLARILRKKILEKCEQMNKTHVTERFVTSHHINTKVFRLTDFKSQDVAEQMTAMDARLFADIEIPEVLLWAREQLEDKSPHLATFTEHFNKMSYWCRSLILQQDDPKERERFLMKFIKIMKQLRKINNFNSYLAILSALDSAPVRRLEWQKQNVEALREFCQLIDSSSSFRAYRHALADTVPPCIPYIGLILQDLTFVHIGNQDFLPDGSINFAKRWQQFNILDNMRRFRQCNYQFKTNPKIVQFFNNFDDFLPEEAQWQISEAIKPRGGRRKFHV